MHTTTKYNKSNFRQIQCCSCTSGTVVTYSLPGGYFRIVVTDTLPQPLGSKIKYKTVPNVRCYIFLIKYMI